MIVPKWSQLRLIGSTYVVRATALMPVLGYFIIYNDFVADLFPVDQKIISVPERSPHTIFEFSITTRLHLAYIGLFLIGCGSLMFNTLCPSLIRRHQTSEAYISSEIETLSARDMFDIFERSKHLKQAGDREITRQINSLEQSLSASTVIQLSRQSKIDAMKLDFKALDASLTAVRLLTASAFGAGFIALFTPSAISAINVIAIILKI